MQTFADRMYAKQLAWRRRALAHVKGGDKLKGKPSVHLLPKARWTENLWPGIQPGSTQPLPDYLEKSQVRPHITRHHVANSWVLCANLYFPFRRDGASLDLLAGFLRQQVHPEIAAVTAVELEFVDDLETGLDPATLLGEPRKGRDANQTSPDVAFRVWLDDGSDGLVLTYVTFTENTFRKCSAYRWKLNREQQRRDCWNLPRVLSDPQQHCALWREEKYKRWYLRHLHAPMVRARAVDVTARCPAAVGGYQLFQQQALAEALANAGQRPRLVISTLAYYEGNDDLLGCLRTSGIPDIRTGWAGLFRGNAAFKTFSHQEWVAWVRAARARPGRCNDWLEYVQGRYGL